MALPEDILAAFERWLADHGPEALGRATEDNPDRMLIGVPTIAEHVGVPERVARHLIAIGGLPAFKLPGSGLWCLRPGTLREHYRQLEGDALARGAERRVALAAANKAREAGRPKRSHAALPAKGAQEAIQAAPKPKPSRRRPRRRSAKMKRAKAAQRTPSEGLSTAVADLILLEIDEGLANGSVLFSNHPNASEARSVTRIVRKHLPSVSDAQARQIIAGWIKAGMLHEVEFRTPRGLQKGLKLTPTNVAREESPRRSVKRRNGDAAAR
jgi:hypothetical protein